MDTNPIAFVFSKVGEADLPGKLRQVDRGERGVLGGVDHEAVPRVQGLDLGQNRFPLLHLVRHP
jgi:hypothetical protein